jgi:hypothetical protein
VQFLCIVGITFIIAEMCFRLYFCRLTTTNAVGTCGGADFRKLLLSMAHIKLFYKKTSTLSTYITELASTRQAPSNTQKGQLTRATGKRITVPGYCKEGIPQGRGSQGKGITGEGYHKEGVSRGRDMRRNKAAGQG